MSDVLPKPLIEIGGRRLIDQAIDQLVAVGVDSIAVNVHHKASMIEKHLAARTKPDIRVFHEATLLETGGGVRNALGALGADAFFVLNSDLFWSAGRPLRRLMAAWDDTDMDALLLLYPTVRAVAYYGMGDYMCDPLGRLRRRREREVAPFIFTGAQILHPRLFEDAPDGAFSLNRLYDRAEEAGRLYAIIHDGDWLDVGTLDRLAHAKRQSDASAQGGLF